MRQFLLLILLFSSTLVCSQTINFGDLISGELSTAGEIDSYSFSASAGDVIYIAVRGFGVAPDAEVFEPGGDKIGEISTGASYQSGKITIESTGTHTLTFEDTFSENTGTYNIGFEKIATPENAVAKNFGDLIEGEITTPAQVDLYTFSAQAGDAIYLAVRGVDGVAPRSRVYDSDGNFVGSINTGASYQSGSILIEKTGTHTLVFEETFLENTGTYYIGLEKIATAENAIPKNFGDLIEGEITGPAQVDLYTFSAQAGDVIYLTVKGIDDVAPRSRVYDSDGAFVGSINTGASYHSGSLLIEKSGTHTLVFEETFLENTGTYYMGLEKIAKPENAIAKDFGDLISGNLTAPAQVDLYTFIADEGDVIYLAAKGFGLAPRARIYDADGDFVSSINSGSSYNSGRIEIAKSGVHTITFEETFLEGLGNYSLALEKLFPIVRAEQIALDMVVGRALDQPAQVDLYSFEGLVGDAVYLSVSGYGDVSPRAKMFAPSGEQIGSASSGASSASSIFTLEETGSYIISFEDTFLEDIGDYCLGLALICNGADCQESISIASKFGACKTQGSPGEEINFLSLSTGVDSRSWSFEGGDPSTSTTQNPSITYDNSGSFDVSLTVSLDSESDTDSKIDYILISSDDPIIASFSSEVSSVFEGDEIQFTDESSGNISSWSWEFDGGNPTTSTDQNPLIVYTAAGVYDVQITVDNGDISDSKTIKGYVVVSEPEDPPLEAEFIVDTDSISRNESVQFTDASTGTVTSWSWDFEGGSPLTSTEQNPLVTYAEEGTYDVTLTVGDGIETDELVLTDFIEVSKGPLPDIHFNTISVTPTSIFSGENVSTSVTLSNIGEADAEGDITVHCYLSFDLNLDDEDVLLESNLIADLAIDESKTLEIEFTISEETEPGDYILIFEIDPTNAVEESDEENNLDIATLEVMDKSPAVVSELEDVDVDQGFGSKEIDLAEVFEDPDEDQLTYSVTSENTSVVTATISGTNLILTEQGAGISEITVTADDNEDGSVDSEFLVSVNATGNTRPVVVEDLEDVGLLVDFGTETIELEAIFSDDDGDVLLLTISHIEGASVTATIDDTSLIITEQSLGTTSITIQANDENGGLAYSSFDVIVSETDNSSPIVESPIADLSFEEGFVSENVDFSAVFADADDDDLSYTVTSNDENVASATISGLNIVLIEVGIGDATIVLTADDGNGGIVSDEFIVTINDVNEAPILENPLQDVVYEPGFASATISLEDVFSDPDDDELSYSVTTSDSEIVVASISGENILLTEVGKGLATITITADDGREGTAEDSFDVLIEGNTPPNIENPIDDQILSVGFIAATLSFDNVFSDIDEDELTFSVASTEEDIISVAISGSSIVFIEQMLGEAIITLTADDGRNGIVTDTFNVSIVENSIPFVSEAVQNQEFEFGFTSASFSLSEVFRDLDNDALVFTSSSSNENVVTTSTVNSNLILEEEGIGQSTITVTADDGKGGIAMTTFLVDVIESVLSVASESNYVYPTIVKDIINIESNKKVVKSQIVKLNGTIMKEFGDSQALQMNGLNDGVYILTIYFEDDTKQHLKVILKK